MTGEPSLPEARVGTLRPVDAPLGISVVLVTFNSSHCVEQCLTSITKRLNPAETIVVDNASGDGSVATVGRAAPDAVVIESDTNLGFARACNLGVAQARCDVVMFVNPDVAISRANRQELEGALKQPRLGLLAPLLSSGPETSERHQIFPYRWWLRIILQQTWSSLRPYELQRAARPTRSVTNAWAAAALLFVRREEFLAIGGFDGRYFLYGEDLDLSRRYRDHGLGVRLTDSVVGHHLGSVSSTSADALRVAPLAWSVLGTLEYLSHWEGDRVARRAAATVLRTFRLQRLLLGGLKRVPGLSGRAIRKARQIEQIEAFVYAHAQAAGPAGSSSYCPGARAALKTPPRKGSSA